MPTIQDIVQITVDVQSSSLTRKGFNSLLILGLQTSFAVGWTDGMVRSYTTYQQVLDDPLIVTDSPVEAMARTAFAQKPAIPTLYIAKQLTVNAATPSVDLALAAASNNDWFGLAMESSDVAAIDDAIGWGAANKKYGFFRLTATASLPAAESSYASIWFTTSSSAALKYLDVAAASRLLAYIPGSYTGAYKTLENVESINPSAADETILLANHINFYPTIAGRPVTYQGWAYGATSGYIDTYIGALYLETRMAEDVFAVMAQQLKIPFTNNGINLIVNSVKARLSQSVKDGFLAADPAPIVQAPLASEVSAIDKSNRLLQTIEFEAETAGAIHTVKIHGTIIA
jgi:hypothetical protein